MTKKDKAKTPSGTSGPAREGKSSLEKPLEAHQRLFFGMFAFLADIDCIQDMFSLVIPDLRAQDEKTEREMKKEMALLRRVIKPSRRNLSEALRHTRSLLRAMRSLMRADAMFRGQALVSIVSRYDYFLSGLLKSAYLRNPQRAISSDKYLTYDDLQTLDSLDNLVELFISKDIDGFLRDAHDRQLRVLDQEFKLGIIDNFTELPLFVEITERRNLFVHGGGIVTKYYLKKCKEVNYRVPSNIRPGATLSVSEDYFGGAVTCVYELGVRLAFALACRLYADKKEDIHSALMDVGFSLLESERWELARRVFDFALSWPDKYIANDEARRYYVVDSAIALNNLNRHQEALDLLSKYDWSSQSEKMLLATAVLRRDWKQAENLMSAMPRDKPISEHDYRTWPLFKEFRATGEFRRAFKKVYGKRFLVKLSKVDMQNVKELTRNRAGSGISP